MREPGEAVAAQSWWTMCTPPRFLSISRGIPGSSAQCLPLMTTLHRCEPYLLQSPPPSLVMNSLSVPFLFKWPPCPCTPTLSRSSLVGSLPCPLWLPLFPLVISTASTGVHLMSEITFSPFLLHMSYLFSIAVSCIRAGILLLLFVPDGLV